MYGSYLFFCWSNINKQRFKLAGLSVYLKPESVVRKNTKSTLYGHLAVFVGLNVFLFCCKQLINTYITKTKQ